MLTSHKPAGTLQLSFAASLYNAPVFALLRMFLRRPHTKWFTSIALFFVVACVPIASRAQSSPSNEDVFTADVLFKKGVAELREGNFAEACIAIEASQKLAPRIGTLFTLAECYAQASRPASAVATYDEFVRLVRELPDEQQKRYADRVTLAEEAKVARSKDVALLSLVVPPGAPKDMIVMRDGKPVSSSLLGMPVPVDPGEHVIVVQVPGRTDGTQKVTLQLRERRSVDLVIPAAPVPKTTVIEPSAVTPSALTPRRAVTYGALGLGAAGVVIGGITGGLAVSEAGTVDAECKQYVCTQTGSAAVIRGRSMATWSTIGFVVGGASLAAGAVLFFTLPKAKKNATALDVMFDGSSGFVGVRGMF